MSEGSGRIAAAGATRHRRAIWRRAAAGIGVAAPLAVLAVWLAFQHKPGWYRPAILDDPAERQRARREVISLVDSIGDRLMAGISVELAVGDAQVNEWLAVLPECWPDVKAVIPPGIAAPAVHFQDGLVRVGAYYARGPWRVIANGEAALSLAADGSAIFVSLAAVRGGSLPLPRSLLGGAEYSPPAERSADLSIGAAGTGAGDGRPLGRLPLQRLFSGVTIENRFVWFNGQRPFRIGSLVVGDGQVRLTLDPL